MLDYSPADIDRVFATITDNKDEALETATHFTKDRNGVYWSCPESANGAQAMTYDMVKDQKYKYSVVNWQNIEDALEEVPPTNSLDGEEDFIEFGKRQKKKMLDVNLGIILSLENMNRQQKCWSRNQGIQIKCWREKKWNMNQVLQNM